MLNKVKEGSNMYQFLNQDHKGYTWNPIRGRCPHQCQYCFMLRFPQGELRLDEKALKDDLGQGNFIFVGSSTDMWAEDVPEEWINRVLEHCGKYPNNKYLFQSKNVWRMFNWRTHYPSDIILGTTMETNRDYKISKAPSVYERQKQLRKGKKETNFKVMITLEPLIDFDLKEFVQMIKSIKPEFVNVGADSKGHNLPEPSKEKILLLIEELNKFTKVNLKDNLKRLMR